MQFDPADVLRASRLRIGKVRAMGILAAGTARSLRTIAPMLPETLREIKNVIDAGRDARTLKP